MITEYKVETGSAFCDTGSKSRRDMKRELSIYIHIPFCVRKCLYCDFLSFPVGEVEGSTVPGKKAACGSLAAHDTVSGAACGGTALQGAVYDTETIDSYVNLLCREIIQSALAYNQYQVISVFLGGGTPSLLTTDQIGRIMEAVRRHYWLAADAEVTMEMNPGTVADGEPERYITYGINRISIGLQSADDGELRRIGRIHDYAAFLRTYDLVRRAGFRNVNIDVMAALPGQSVGSYEQTLRKVTALAPEHISAYSLILEEGTPLYEGRSQYCFPTEEENLEMDLLTRRYLAGCGYHRYEISNYAREGYECRHNKVYWQRGDYVGFGPGAASMAENVRWSNPSSLEAYRAYVTGQQSVSADAAPEAGQCGGAVHRRQTEAVRQSLPDCGDAPHRQVLTLREQMEEYMFLGLRMVCGVSAAEFARNFGRPIEEVYGGVTAHLRQQGLLMREGDRVRLTERGLDVSNYAMAQFLFD